MEMLFNRIQHWERRSHRFHSEDTNMKRFEQLHIEDQTRILTALIEFETDNPIKQRTKEHGVTPADIWRDVCAEAGFDECIPWEGFPEMPKDRRSDAA
jgi:hypothetical protein